MNKQVALMLAASILAGSGCMGRRSPVLEPLRARADRSPVVLVPGLSGTKLRERSTGRVVWGNTRSLFLPRDGGLDVALPLDPAARAADDLEPFAPILSLSLLGIYKRKIYGPVLRLLERNGYVRGSLRDPRPGDTFFFFDHDWRRSSAELAAELAHLLERLPAARGEKTTDVTLLCQSNAALICRYLVKYGSASIARAEAGESRPPAGVRFDKVVLVGAANGGSLRVLREMHRGRSYVPLVGRRWKPEALFTLDSLYEGLPVYRDDLFFDVGGQPVDADLFDAASWERFGWSIHASATARRVEQPRARVILGDAEMRRRHLERNLDRSKRLHRLLIQDPAGFVPPRYYSVANGRAPTPERALLFEKDGRRQIRFMQSRRVRRDPRLLALARSPGDGHATVESQRCLSPRELGAFAVPPVYIAGGHFEVILETQAQRRLLEFLQD